MMLTSIVLIIIAITGILLIHEDDTTLLSRVRIPAAILPEHYQTRLNNLRIVQGMANQFNTDRNTVPLSWLIYDLHSGEFFGRWAWIYYDLLSAALVVYSVTGVYMFFKLMNNQKKKKTKIGEIK